jgi:hypothetical protein
MSAAMEDPQQQAQRARANTHFSVRSDESNHLSPTKSRQSQSKHERKTSESEKRHTQYDLTTKANPNSAMNEAQPSMLRPCSEISCASAPLQWSSREAVCLASTLGIFCAVR